MWGKNVIPRADQPGGEDGGIKRGIRGMAGVIATRKGRRCRTSRKRSSRKKLAEQNETEWTAVGPESGLARLRIDHNEDNYSAALD